jgi:hypothetical protein
MRDGSVHPQIDGAGISFRQALLEDFEIISAGELCAVNEHESGALSQF